MAESREPAIRITGLNLWYDRFQALFDVDLDVDAGRITAMIGPSGCGKSTLLRCVNRINERNATVRTSGTVAVLGHDVQAPQAEAARVRRYVGMVFQRPNPLPLTIRQNVLFGLEIHSEPGQRPSRSQREEIVEGALRQVLLWDAVKDRLDERATALSLEEQQKLCIGRLLPVEPAVILMDEPCSALDPAATEAVEELIWTLRERATILIVTHNMAQARRSSEQCIFMLMGKVVEHSGTAEMFVAPQHQETADYIEGRFG